MTAKHVHLRKTRTNADADYTPTVCGTYTASWTDDPQAVTCERCISKMELQPA